MIFERDLFPAIVYILCFLTSATCVGSSVAAMRRTRARLLFWSSICFGFLALNNLLLVLDLVVWPAPEVDLRLPRLLMALAAVASLIWGFIWDVEEN